MARRKANLPPPYPRKPHRSGQARITVDGNDVYLGPYGSRESYLRYQKIIETWSDRAQARESKRTPESAPALTTIADLAIRWTEHVRSTYLGPDGSLKKEGVSLLFVMRPLVRMWGHLGIAEFTARHLLELRPVLLRGEWLTEHERAAREKLNGRARVMSWSRRTANRNLTRIKTMFSWADLQELIPEGRLERLRNVPGIAPGEFGATDPEEVTPVSEEMLAATLPLLHCTGRAMCDTLLLTGARIGELLRLHVGHLQRAEKVRLRRGVEIDTHGCWIYRPELHKTARHGHQRIILFGPRAQAVIAPLLSGKSEEDWVFSSPRTVGSYGHLVICACDKAYPPPKKEWERQLLSRNGKTGRRRRERWKHVYARLGANEAAELRAWQNDHRWHPHQLRHNAATKLCEQYGAEVARIILGHRALEVTRQYVEDSLERAAQVMREVG